SAGNAAAAAVDAAAGRTAAAYAAAASGAALNATSSNPTILTSAALTAAARSDGIIIEEGQSRRAKVKLAIAVVGQPLWPTGTPSWANDAWKQLKDLLLGTDKDWEPWTQWYEDRLSGRPSLGEAFDIAIATLPDALWRQGPTAVN